jgi:hypothetical protein
MFTVPVAVPFRIVNCPKEVEPSDTTTIPLEIVKPFDETT